MKTLAQRLASEIPENVVLMDEYGEPASAVDLAEQWLAVTNENVQDPYTDDVDGEELKWLVYDFVTDVIEVARNCGFVSGTHIQACRRE